MRFEAGSQTRLRPSVSECFRSRCPFPPFVFLDWHVEQAGCPDCRPWVANLAAEEKRAQLS